VRSQSNSKKSLVQGWISEEAMVKIIGKNYDALVEEAIQKDFSPYVIGKNASTTVRNSLKQFSSNNFIATLPSDNNLATPKYLFYSAHWDLFGVKADGSIAYGAREMH